MFGPASRRMQEEHGSRASYARRSEGDGDDLLGDFEREFIAARDSFYLASVTPDGWPYVQHRGGARGFLQVLDERRLAFADVAGNKQYITAGNLATNDRVALFLMDYPDQARLKVIGHARIVNPGEDAALEARVRAAMPGARLERIVMIEVVGFDWNCSQHIVPRFTREEIG
jgi:predicted pyridoxine 5'-phosphate oxidase superfamily flavin-nucleotide-binding protein